VLINREVCIRHNFINIQRDEMKDKEQKLHVYIMALLYPFRFLIPQAEVTAEKSPLPLPAASIFSFPHNQVAVQLVIPAIAEDKKIN
jgi:hypothetical protein